MSVNQALEGKVALVTGASRGIGLAIAMRLAAMGAKLGICARDSARLDSVAGDLRRSGTQVCAVAADMTRPDDISSLAKKTEHELGPVEILVNNAGIGYFAPVQEASEKNWDDVLDTNLKAVFLLSKAIAPAMIERRAGHIINIS